jgi:hypothetical protein
MGNRMMAGFSAAICLIFLTMLCPGYANAQRQSTQQLVVTEYLLEKAGFQKWDVNMETPKRQALLNAIPKGKISTYLRNGEVYHVYGDERSQTLYIGDEAAYQRYLSMAKGKQLCERVDATDSAKFWSCFDDFQKAGGGQQGK